MTTRKKATPTRHLITAALPYANGPLHIGHLAGAYLPADIYARHLRSKGEEVLFVCGSDEHGAAITLRARKDGTSPQEIVDRYHEMLDKSFVDFGLSVDIYHRTSSARHHQVAADYFKKLEADGRFVKKTTEQYYDESESQFLADRYIQGTCPRCGNPDAYGDQCEKCGATLSPTELIDPRSTLSGSAPTLKETSHWFLPLDRYAEWVGEWLDTGVSDGVELHDPSQWKKHVIGQCRSWIDSGLMPRAMTRDLDWGVRVPVAGGEDKVLYVWLDAPIGYISATQQWAEDHDQEWEKWWQDEDTELVQFIGKDNIVFHCIIFPILLHLHGGMNLPTNVPANEFLNLEGEKLSTSRNHAVWLHEYLEEMPTRKDELRYVLTSIMPETKDSEFTWADYQARVNNELVAILGNFVNRCVVLMHKYFDGIVPAVSSDYRHPADVQAILDEASINVDTAIRSFRFREGLQAAMEPARVGNKFLADTEPWKLIKTDEQGVKEILYSALSITACLADVIRPYLPDTSQRLRDILLLDEVETMDSIYDLAAGHRLGEAQLLFNKVEDQEMDHQREKLASAKAMATSNAEASSASKTTAEGAENIEGTYTPPAFKPEITFDDFLKLDIRTGVIISAEKVKKADKLLHLRVQVGAEEREVVSGIAEHFAPEEIIGQQVSLLLNLPYRKIRGVESQAMILMAEDANGRLDFVSPGVSMGSGSVVR